MPVQPDTDRRLEKTSGTQTAVGSRLLLAAAAMYIIGALFLALSVSTFVGLAFIALATPVAIAGLATSGSGLVGKRFARHKDWA